MQIADASPQQVRVRASLLRWGAWARHTSLVGPLCLLRGPTTSVHAVKGERGSGMCWVMREHEEVY